MLGFLDMFDYVEKATLNSFVLRWYTKYSSSSCTVAQYSKFAFEHSCSSVHSVQDSACKNLLHRLHKKKEIINVPRKKVLQKLNVIA